MRRNHVESCHRAVLAGLLASALPLAAAPPARLHADIQSRQTFVLSGNTHPRLAAAVDQGEVESSFAIPRIAIHFKMTPAQQADLDSLLKAQQDRSSPQYHKWLTAEQYADRFGLVQSDIARITTWLQSMGFSDIQVAHSRSFVTMSGTAATVRYAFQTAIHHYRVDGTVHYANAADPALPAELRGIVAGIRGLNDFHPRPHSRPRPRYTSSLTGNTFLAPADFAVIYDVQALYNSGLNGSGQSIAVAGQTDILLSDIAAFQTAAGLPVKAPRVVLDGTDPGISAGDLSEADLDLEWAGAIAPGANIVYVNSTDVFNSATYAVDNNLAPILSLTYGNCEAAFTVGDIDSMNSVLAQANGMGITVVVASGDLGAADCDTLPSGFPATIATQGLAVDFPASSPYATGMGGTEFNEGGGTYWATSNGANAESALSYIPEIAWNDTVSDGELAATGGGASALFTKPSWQQAPGVPNDGARDVPDVSFAASADHDGYLICSSDSSSGIGPCTNGFRDSTTNLNVSGGTSCGAPTFAGVVALLNQKTNSSQGNINPALYTLARASTSTAVYHDIVLGGNQVPCSIGTPNCTTGIMGYAAGPGYDQVTGLGSMDAFNLVGALASATPTPTPTPPPAPVQTSPANGASGLPVPLTLIWQASSGATSYNVFFGTAPQPPMVSQTTSTFFDPGSLGLGVKYYWSVTAVNSSGSTSSPIWSFTTTSSSTGGAGLEFFPVTPCRIADTRNASGPFGGPSMTGGETRSFAVPQSGCGIPATAQAYSMNVTVVPQGPLSFLTLWPSDQTQPGVSTLNSFGGIVVANAAMVPAGAGGSVDVYVTNPTDVILDINGYFSQATGGASFYAATPCRLVDTRAASPFGGSEMTAGETRSFPIPSLPCSLPASASAYSMNVTVVPAQTLSYLTAWPTGETQPNVSTLNSFTGKVVANAAIVPAGTAGAISVFVTNATNVILDDNGYFGAPGGSGALIFYPVPPCRVADTRNANGPFGGPIMAAGSIRLFTVPGSTCSIPSNAAAYSMNVTVVPAGPLSFLTAWPAGAARPFVSTLNSFDGSVVANAAIVPAGASGAISIYVTDTTNVILDINGYFAP